jgi:adenylate cyclase
MRRSDRKRVARLGLALVAAAVSGLRMAGRRPPRPEAVYRGPIQSIAVLPFKALAGESDRSSELGMADALITRLSGVRRNVVRSTGSVLKYTGTDDPLAAGRDLKVDAVLERAVQQAAGRIRVSARLINVEDGAPLWADHFDEPWTHVFGVQDAISERVVQALTIELTGPERQRLTRRGTESVEAYRAYILGRLHWNHRTAEELTQAIAYFEKAITIDPSYTLPTRDWRTRRRSSPRSPVGLQGTHTPRRERRRCGPCRSMRRP